MVSFPSSLLPEWRTVERLVAMRLDNAGDVIMTGPALRALRECYPSAHITLMTSRVGANAARLLPWIDGTFEWRVLWQDLGILSFDPDREWLLVETLRAGGFDGAIIFTSFSQTPFPAAVAARLAGIPLRLGESSEADEGCLSHQPRSFPVHLHQVERNLRLIESIGITVRDRKLEVAVTDAADERVRALLRESGTGETSEFLLVNPWATAQARMYPVDRLARVCHRLHEETMWPVLVTGSEREREKSAEFADAVGRGAVNLAGLTDFSELAALMRRSRLVITNDTSTLHLADALRVPEVVLFSGTDLEEQWYPRHTACRLLRKPTPCSPCYAFVCPYDLECLDIPAEEVVSAALDLIAETDPFPTCLNQNPRISHRT